MSYGWYDRLPDLDPDPPSPDWECNNCGKLFNIAKWAEAICPNCDGDDMHRT